AFVLHGLWPQHDKSWPEDCPIGKRPWVPSPVIDEMRISCQARASSSTNTARTGPAHASIQRNILASRASSISASNSHTACRLPIPQKSLSVDEIKSAFESANPWLKPEMIAVSCRGDNLLDVRICFGRDLFPLACGANEDEARLCRIDNIAVPPVEPAKP